MAHGVYCVFPVSWMTSCFKIVALWHVLLVFIVEQNFVAISSIVLVVFHHRLKMLVTCHRAIILKRDVIHKTRNT